MATDLFADDPITEAQAAESTKPRRRGRPRKVNAAVLLGEGDTPDAEPKPKRTRRSRKASGADIALVVAKSSNWYAGMTGRQWWQIPPDEQANIEAAWGNDLADLMNRLPAHYVRGAFDALGYVAIAVGMFTTFAPRIAADQHFKRQQTRGGTPPVPPSPNGAETPSDPLSASVWGTVETSVPGD